MSNEQEPDLARAVEQTERQETARLGLKGFSLEEDGTRFRLDCDGATDFARKRTSLRCDYGERGRVEAIEVSDVLYLRGAGAGNLAQGVAEGQWIKLGSPGDASLLHGLAPDRLLLMIRAAREDAERLGEERVRGVATVGYRLSVDCGQGQLGCIGDASPVEIWIDGQDLLRRISLETLTGGGTFEFFDFGADVVIEPPPADQVVDPATGNAKPCSDEEATPITEDRALQALRSHGLSVASDRSGYCIDGVAAVLANAPENFSREGSVSCFLRVKPAPGATRTVKRSGVDGGDAELELANLTCMILADSPKSEEMIDPLEAAFEDLERSIRP